MSQRVRGVSRRGRSLALLANPRWQRFREAARVAISGVSRWPARREFGRHRESLLARDVAARIRERFRGCSWRHRASHASHAALQPTLYYNAAYFLSTTHTSEILFPASNSSIISIPSLLFSAQMLDIIGGNKTRTLVHVMLQTYLSWIGCKIKLSTYILVLVNLQLSFHLHNFWLQRIFSKRQKIYLEKIVEVLQFLQTQILIKIN